MISITKSLLPVLLSTGIFVYGQNTSAIKITFADNPSAYKIYKSPLKYNKDFAYSFTFDDGKEDAYTVAYTLFRGGWMKENNINYPGLYFTDGCGNKIPFKGGLAINSVNAVGEDPHVSFEGSLKWSQISELYASGWNVFNHSYSHSTDPTTDYNYQVTQNTAYIKSKTGINLTHFVIPSGDINYLEPAYNHGMKAVYNQKDFPGSNGFKVDGPVDLNRFKLFRRFLDDEHFTSNNIKTYIDQVASQSTNGNHYWYSEFTHHVGFQSNGGSLIFSTFENYMNYIENTYGSKGADRVWMAPLQEVYEYITVRDKVSIGDFKNQNTVEAGIDFTNVPHDLQKFSLTLLVESDQDIAQVEGMGVTVKSFKGTGPQKLINLEWSQHPNSVTLAIDPVKINLGQCPLSSAEVHPNPIQSSTISLLVNGEEGDEILIYLIDNNGKETFLGTKKTIKSQDSLEINIQEYNLPPGSYLLRLNSQKENCETSKVIVKY